MSPNRNPKSVHYQKGKPKQTKKNTHGVFVCLFVGEGESKEGRGKAENGWAGEKGRQGQGNGRGTGDAGRKERAG